jgi:hypothetical protein
VNPLSVVPAALVGGGGPGLWTGAELIG